MKLFFLPALLSLAALAACGQQKDLDRFYNKYSSSDALSGQFSINPAVFLSHGQNAEWKDKVSKFRVLILDGKKSPDAADDARDLARRLQKDNYDELVSFRKGSKGGELLCRDLDDHHRDLVLLIRGDDDGLVFAEMEGRFTDKDLDAIRGAVQ